MQDYRPHMYVLCIQGILLHKNLSNKQSSSVILDLLDL